MSAVNTSSPPKLLGDAPKRTIEHDEFGLSKIVAALAHILTERIATDTYALGIQGRWGSGKSTFVKFVAEKIARDLPAHQVIRFDPWLVGHKGALLAFFLGQLAPIVDKAEWATLSWEQRIDHWFAKRLGRRLADKVRKYGEYAAALATPVGGLAATDTTGATALAAVGLKSAGTLKTFLDANASSLEQLKEVISKDLLRLKKKQPGLRFTVIIDDTDRLEPSEAVEVLRLVRRAADFPLITFVVCYDDEILAKQVETALHISNGHEYIEKIFENILAIPPHEPFALRRHLRDLLTIDFPNEMSSLSAIARDVGYRQHIVLDIWAGALVATPRDVVRLHEAIKFGWCYVPAGSDFLDFVWLQLVKLKLPTLYRWTQDYLAGVGAYRDGGRAGDTEPRQRADSLHEIMKEYQWHERAYRSGIDSILPGVASFSQEGDARKVFDFQNDELNRYERDQRLGSPTHWRQYFAFDLPTYALSDEYVASFRKALVDRPGEAERIVIELAGRPHATPGHFLSVLLDRLSDAGRKSFSDAEILRLLRVFGETMDDVVLKTEEFKKRGSSDIWFKTARLLDERLAAIFEEVVRSGSALNWLAEIVRDQGFAHGLPEGSNHVDPGRQWLGRDKLARAIEIIIERAKSAGAATIFAKPSPLDILFCWHQLGDKEGVRAFVTEAVAEDVQFLDALNAMRAWSSSGEGIRHPVPRNYVDLFIDAEAAKARLTNLANGEDVPEHIKSRAEEILRDWIEGRY